METMSQQTSFLEDFKKCIADFEDSDEARKANNGSEEMDDAAPAPGGDETDETNPPEAGTSTGQDEQVEGIHLQKQILLSALSAASSVKSEDMESYHQENRKTLDESLGKPELDDDFNTGNGFCSPSTQENDHKPPPPHQPPHGGNNVTRYNLITGGIYQQQDETQAFEEKPATAVEDNPSSPMNLVINMKDYSCKVCRKVFDSRSGLRKHICRLENEDDLTGENGYSQEPTQDGEINGKYQLDGLGMMSHGVDEIRQSPLMQTQRPDLTPSSEMQYPAVEAMETQMPSTEDSLNIDIKSQPGQLFMCPICSMTFTQASVLTRHYRAHSNERPHECKDCHKAFRRKCHLKRHWQRIHSGEKPFKCGICGKAFSDRDHQRQHETIHGPETYPCLKCRSVFPTEQYLAAHVGEHPDCKAAFAASADNQIKRLRGTKGKGMPGSYRCGLCGDFFKKLRQIQTHQRVRHHDAFEKKYKCNICQKGFDLISDLTHHRSTHVLRGSKYDMDRDTKSSSSGTSAKKQGRMDTTEGSGENKAELMQMLQQLEKRIQMQERRVQQMEHRQENLTDEFVEGNDLDNSSDEIGSKLRYMLERPLCSPSASDMNSHEGFAQLQNSDNSAIDYSRKRLDGSPGAQADGQAQNSDIKTECMNGIETQTKAVLDLMFKNRHKCKECGLSFLLYSEFRDHRKRHERARAAFGIEGGGEEPKHSSQQMVCGNPDGDRNLCRDCCNENEPHPAHSHSTTDPVNGGEGSSSATPSTDGDAKTRVRTRSSSRKSPAER